MTLASSAGAQNSVTNRSAEAQNSSTNLLTTEQAVKLASRLQRGMREKDVTTLLESGGLKCDLISLGSVTWVNDCKLANGRRLVLEFRGPGLRGEDGLLISAYITTRMGEKVRSITLTNGPLTIPSQRTPR
jgi:hypothetical protein